MAIQILLRDRYPSSNIFMVGLILSLDEQEVTEVWDGPTGNLEDFQSINHYFAPQGVFVLWSVADAWPFLSHESEWDILHLAFDMVITLLIILGSTACCEFWFRRRGGRARFKLIDLLLMTTLFAALHGWWQYNIHLIAMEQETISAFKEAGCLSDKRVVDESGTGGYRSHVIAYSGPDWLRRLVGNEGFLRSCAYRVVKLSITTDKMEKSQGEAIANLKHLEEISLEGQLSEYGNEILESHPSIKKIRYLPQPKTKKRAVFFSLSNSYAAILSALLENVT